MIDEQNKLQFNPGLTSKIPILTREHAVGFQQAFCHILKCGKFPEIFTDMFHYFSAYNDDFATCYTPLRQLASWVHISI